jgi:hypothetical protein
MVLHIGLDLRPRPQVLWFMYSELTLFPKHYRRYALRGREAGQVADTFCVENPPSHVKLVPNEREVFLDHIWFSLALASYIISG